MSKLPLTPQMLPGPKKLLIEALRSGDYKQGHRFLTTLSEEGDLDYCLGVACKVAEKEGIPLRWEIEVGFDDTIRVKSYFAGPNQKVGGRSILPRPIVAWLFGELLNMEENTNPRIHRLDLEPDSKGFLYEALRNYRSLAELNDRGSTFEEIANIIELYF